MNALRATAGSWLEEVAARPVLATAAALGLELIDGRHIAPCPSCNEDKRSRSDRRRGPVFAAHGGSGWKCGSCGAAGGSVRLAELVAFGSALPSGDPRWGGLRALCAERGLCTAAEVPASAPVPVAAPARPAPPVLAPVRAHDVAEVWASCLPVVDDHEVAAWLRSRKIAPDVVVERDLCRALPDRLPEWARIAGLPWSAGWRCVFPTFDSAGELAGLRARFVRGVPPDGRPKAAAPALGTGSASGMVHADRVARAMLRGKPSPKGRPWLAIVTEGEPDFLTWSTRFSDDARPHAVLGVWSGAWTDDLAARIPTHAHVAIQTHHDEAGEQYFTRIVRSLAGRCALTRIPPRKPHA